jgi:glucose dehydrogenase
VDEAVSTLSRAEGRVTQQQARRKAEYLTRSYNQAQRKAEEFKAQDASVGFGAAPAAAKLDQAAANIGLDRVASVWAFQGSRPCVYRGRLYTSQHDILRCTDVKTGGVYWEADFGDRKRFEGGRALTPPAIAGDSVYLATATGQVFCLDANSGKIRWHAEVGEGITFQPAVMNGRVYVATDRGSLFSLDARNPKATGWAMWGGNARHNGLVQAK